MDYTALQAYVVSQLHRTSASMDTMVPTFIELARLRIGRDVRGLANLKTTSITSWTSEAGALPTDLSKLRSVTNANFPYAPIPSEQFEWGQLNVYCVRGQFIMIPGIANGTSILIEYWAIPVALSAGTDVSAGMAEWPQIWSLASLLEAAQWQRDYETYGQVSQLYDAEVTAVNAACREALYGNAPQIVSDQPMIQSVNWL